MGDPGYADLSAREPGQSFRVVEAARACTFAPEAAIRALGNDCFQAVADIYGGMTSFCHNAIASLRAAKRVLSPGDPDGIAP